MDRHNIKAWLKKHPRFQRPFTPTSASWLNQVERFLSYDAFNRL